MMFSAIPEPLYAELECSLIETRFRFVQRWKQSNCAAESKRRVAEMREERKNREGERCTRRKAAKEKKKKRKAAPNVVQCLRLIDGYL